MVTLKVGNLIYSEYAIDHGGHPALLYIDKLDEFKFYYTGCNLRNKKTYRNSMEYDVISTWKDGYVFAILENKKAAQKYINLLGHDFEIPS